MAEIYDQHFETQRLTQLSEQCLGMTEIDGELIFRSSDCENTLEVVSWFFEDQDYEQLIACNFQSLLMRLLDDFIIYRTRCEMADSREGVVTLTKSKASISWLKDGQGEALATKRRAAENVL